MIILSYILNEQDDMHQTIKEAGCYKLVIKTLKDGMESGQVAQAVQAFCLFFQCVLKHFPHVASMLTSMDRVADLVACMECTIADSSAVIAASELLWDLCELDKTSIELSFQSAAGFSVLLEAKNSHPGDATIQEFLGALLIKLSVNEQDVMSNLSAVESFNTRWVYPSMYMICFLVAVVVVVVVVVSPFFNRSA